jgi:formiminotetrahydrofolate cyclodeaminase
MGVKNMLRDLALSDFSDSLASEEPAPGGGSASAAVAALGASLMVMTCNLTIGRERFRDADGDLLEVREEMETLRVWLLAAVDRDSVAYDDVTAAFRMPKGTSEERATRGGAIQTAMRTASEVPMDVARRCARALDLGVVVAELGNPNALSDTGCGARFLEAGMRGALYNVGINLASIKDDAYVQAMSADARALLGRAMGSLDRIVQRVEAESGLS